VAAALAQVLADAAERVHAQIAAAAAAAGAFSELRAGAIRARAAFGGKAASLADSRDLQRDGPGDRGSRVLLEYAEGEAGGGAGSGCGFRAVAGGGNTGPGGRSSSLVGAAAGV